MCHNHLRDAVFNLCCPAHLSISMEKGHGVSNTRPAGTLIARWERSKSTALYRHHHHVTTQLCHILGEPYCQAGAAALVTEACKLHSTELDSSASSWDGPAFIPLAVETYGNWGREARDTISRLASHFCTFSEYHPAFSHPALMSKNSEQQFLALLISV